MIVKGTIVRIVNKQVLTVEGVDFGKVERVNDEAEHAKYDVYVGRGARWALGVMDVIPVSAAAAVQLAASGKISYLFDN